MLCFTDMRNLSVLTKHHIKQIVDVLLVVSIFYFYDVFLMHTRWSVNTTQNGPSCTYKGNHSTLARLQCFICAYSTCALVNMKEGKGCREKAAPPELSTSFSNQTLHNAPPVCRGRSRYRCSAWCWWRAWRWSRAWCWRHTWGWSRAWRWYHTWCR